LLKSDRLLAVDKDLLRVIYEAMAHETVEWQSLFLGGRFQSWWAHGPVLVDVREAPVFQEQLPERLESQPIGVLLRSDLSVDALFSRLVYWTNDALGKEGSVLRFHEPRMFGPLVCALSDGPVEELTGCGSAWYWHDTHSWQSMTPATALTEDQARVALPPGMVTRTFIDAARYYRLAADARGYAHYYRGHLPETQDPDNWVLQRLLEGQDAGVVEVMVFSRPGRWHYVRKGVYARLLATYASVRYVRKSRNISELLRSKKATAAELMGKIRDDLAKDSQKSPIGNVEVKFAEASKDVYLMGEEHTRLTWSSGNGDSDAQTPRLAVRVMDVVPLLLDASDWTGPATRRCEI
jgi:hypothetical protein